VRALRDEVTVLAEQMAAVGSSVGPGTWCGDSADAFRDHVAELEQNAAGLARGYDEVGVALRAHAHALDALYEVVADAERRLEQGERDRRQASADLQAAQRALEGSRSRVLAAQQQQRSAAADPTGAAQVGASEAVSAAHGALAAAGQAVNRAQAALATAERAIRTAEQDLDEADREHRRIGEQCGDQVLDARERPFSTHAWEFVVSAISSMGGPDWTDFMSGVTMMPAVAAKEMLGRADDIGSTLRELKQARRQGSPAERAAARTAYNAALREVRTLRRDVTRLPWRPPGWLQAANTSLGDRNDLVRRFLPGVRVLPGISVVAAAASTAIDSSKDEGDPDHMGVGHAIAKNAASLGAGAGVSYGIVAGAAAVGAVGLAPVVVGVVVGGLVAAGVGYAVQEYGDDVAEAAGEALDSAGDALGDVKDGIKGIFS